jgi:hypothetical protein
LPVKTVAGPPIRDKPKWHGVKQRQRTSKKSWNGLRSIGPTRPSLATFEFAIPYLLHSQLKTSDTTNGDAACLPPAKVPSKELLEGNRRDETMALGDWDGKSTMEPPIPMLWATEKGKKLLAKINEETGLVFEKETYQVVEPEPQEAEPAEGEVIITGYYAIEREAALAYDRVAIFLHGDDAETNFPPEESEHVVLSDDIMWQINALKAGRGRLQ